MKNTYRQYILLLTLVSYIVSHTQVLALDAQFDLITSDDTTPQDRSSEEYLGPIECSSVDYCAQQSAAYIAAANNDTTNAPRYSIDSSSVVCDATTGKVQADLILKDGFDQTLWSAPTNLSFMLQVYGNGAARVSITNPDETNYTRFNVAEHTSAGVDWDTINSYYNMSSVKFFCDTETKQDGNVTQTSATNLLMSPVVDGPDGTLDPDETGESHMFSILYDPFRVVTFANDQTLISVNDGDTLFYQWNADTQEQAISMGFYVNAAAMYGIPSRATEFTLNTTETQGPYRLWNQDNFTHPWGTNSPLYGAVPYLMGHDAYINTGVAWMNAAETWVDIFEYENYDYYGTGKHISFTSEGGAMDFWLLGSSFGPKWVQTQLADISGYGTLPSYPSLGFHFCKWEYNTAQMLIDRNDNFTKTGFPVDVLWSDIEHTEAKAYFTFNKTSWPVAKVNELNEKVQNSKRRMVLITDPHIKNDTDYPVFSNGNDLEATSTDDNKVNIFIKNGTDTSSNFVGECWPGASVWVDYVNENAQEYWGTLYSYKNFKGQSYLYGAWNDMNEPAVFQSGSGDEHSPRGMPVHNLHYTSAGLSFEHKWVHNAYGSLQHGATFKGLLARDNQQLRPFVLSRSYFFGTQRYSAMWTGDSSTNWGNVEMSVNNLLTLGVSGIYFGGCDMPGFAGNPSDDLAVAFYELGAFYPFMRAHNNMNFTSQDQTSNAFNREPWLQSPRVQQVIRQSIWQRYNFMHYLYTTFFQATQTGWPIMRPLWYEFRADEATFGVNNQFMWGDSIMVAPKVNAPTYASGVYLQSIYLPNNETNATSWYFYPTRQMMTGVAGQYQDFYIGDAQLAVFVKAGTVLPILNFEVERMSILQAINDPIRLEIFPDSNNFSSGQLYLDDGLTNDYQSGSYSQFEFTYDNGTLYVETLASADADALWAQSSNKMVSEVVIANVESQPFGVMNKWVDSVSYPDQGEVSTFMNYLPDEKELRVYGVMWPILNGQEAGTKVELLSIQWTDPNVTFE